MATAGRTASSIAGDRFCAAPPHMANWLAGLRHLAYAAGWKKFEPLWDLVIRAKRTAIDAAGARVDSQRVRPAVGAPLATDTQTTATPNAVGTPDPSALCRSRADEDRGGARIMIPPINHDGCVGVLCRAARFR